MATQSNQSQYLTLFNKSCAHNLSTSQDNQANLSNSLASSCPPDSREYVLKRSPADLGEQDFPVKWFKFSYPSSKPTMTETSTCTPVHVAYSPLASINHQWTINLHYGYTSFHTLMPVEYIPPFIPTLCNLMSHVSLGIDFLHSTQDTQHDLSSLIASPKGEMTSSFSSTRFFKSPTSSTLCFGDPTLAKLNQVISVSMCETVLCTTKSATKPPNTKTWACKYLQKEPSMPSCDEPSRDTDAHHTYRSQYNHQFTCIDVGAYLGRDLPTTLQDQWKCSRHKLMTSQFPFMTLLDYQFY